MAGPDGGWIDAFLEASPGVAEGAPPTPAAATPATAAGAPGFGGSDLIGIGYLSGGAPAEIRAKLASAFGFEPEVAPLEQPALWR